MPWWLWALFGLVLLILEVQTSGSFYLMFFGLGALLVSLIVGLGGAEQDWVQWLLFSVLSLALLALLRRAVVRRLAPASDPPVEGVIGETAVTVEDIAAGEIGRAELRGTVWSARNAGTVPMPKGERCRVERVDGLTLWLRPE